MEAWWGSRRAWPAHPWVQVGDVDNCRQTSHLILNRLNNRLASRIVKYHEICSYYVRRCEETQFAQLSNEMRNVPCLLCGQFLLCCSFRFLFVSLRDHLHGA